MVFNSEIVSLIKSKGYFDKDNRHIYFDNYIYCELFQLGKWYYSIMLKLFPANAVDKTELLEARVIRTTYQDMNKINDDGVMENCWVYEYNGDKFSLGNKDTLVDGLVINNYRRKNVKKNFCSICQKHFQSNKQHIHTKLHNKNKDKIHQIVGNETGLNDDIMGVIMSYL